MIEAFADPAMGAAPLATRLSVTGYDPDGGALRYRWAFTDGTFVGSAVTRTFAKPGTYTAKVTATDDEGDTSTRTVTVTVTAPAVLPPTVERDVRPHERSGAPDGPVRCHGHRSGWAGGRSCSTPGTSAMAGKPFQRNPTHTYTHEGHLHRDVTVTDGSGASASKTITITVTDPAGQRRAVRRRPASLHRRSAVATFTRRRLRPRRRHGHVRAGLRRRQRPWRRHRGRAHATPAPGTYKPR